VLEIPFLMKEIGQGASKRTGQNPTAAWRPSARARGSGGVTAGCRFFVGFVHDKKQASDSKIAGICAFLRLQCCTPTQPFAKACAIVVNPQRRITVVSSVSKITTIQSEMRYAFI
jgi:hypothetical protein